MNANGNGRSHAALVVGAGIAGIQAALDIADAGFALPTEPPLLTPGAM